MLFTSLVFMSLFLPGLLLFYYVIFKGRRTLKNLLLLAASLFFYAWGQPAFVGVMAASVAVTWLFGLLAQRYRENAAAGKAIVALMLIVNLSTLFFYKYLNFTLSNINNIFHTELPLQQIALPIGISFFTFKAISYVIDIYRGKAQAQKNPLNTGLYISFFPQLLAGPISRYDSFADQIMNRRESFELFSEGACLFIVGFAKKVLICNNIALLADRAFGTAPWDFSVAFAWMGAIAYTLQIYFDFSGYSDMAIGLGKMFGFQCPKNFDYPYISRSVSEFWRRWHISLGSWFRDYVYFSLGGSRVKSKIRLMFNLFVVWALTGLWHGANWTFIVWGLMYFVLIAVEKLTGLDKLGTKQGERESRAIYYAKSSLKWIYTMFFVVLGWVIFRSDTMAGAVNYMKAMFGLGGTPLTDPAVSFFFTENFWFLFLGILFSFPVAGAASSLMRRILGEGNKVWAIVYLFVMMGILICSMAYVIKGSYNPFIYFNF